MYLQLSYRPTQVTLTVIHNNDTQSLAHVHCHIATYKSPIHTLLCHTPYYMPPSAVTFSHNWGQSHKEVTPVVTRLYSQ